MQILGISGQAEGPSFKQSSGNVPVGVEFGDLASVVESFGNFRCAAGHCGCSLCGELRENCEIFNIYYFFFGVDSYVSPLTV